jgi:release factor glutamine methyltransferase
VLVRDWLGGAAERLRDAGVPMPRTDSELIAMYALGLRRHELTLTASTQLRPVELSRLESAVTRRLGREPLQHILGEAGFRRLILACDSRALIPRSETETVVEVALGFLRGKSSPRVADLGTGSGCIALALADELPSACVVATEPDADALSLAIENRSRTNVEDRVCLVRSSWGDALSEYSFDAVVSNPPYVRDDEYDALEPEVRDYEPRHALLAGTDGLNGVRAVVESAATLLRDSGVVVCEIGETQEDAAVHAARTAGFSDVSVFPDLSGRPRVLSARR